MANALTNNVVSIKIDNLTRASATALYPAGFEVALKESGSHNGTEKRYKYVKSHGALTQYRPYQIVNGSVAGSEVITQVPLTSTGGGTIGVPQVAVPSGEYAFLQVAGFCTALSTGSADGDYLEVLNSGANFVPDGSTGSTVLGGGTVGIQQGAVDGASATVNLFGNTGSTVIAAT